MKSADMCIGIKKYPKVSQKCSLGIFSYPFASLMVVTFTLDTTPNLNPNIGAEMAVSENYQWKIGFLI